MGMAVLLPYLSTLSCPPEPFPLLHSHCKAQTSSCQAPNEAQGGKVMNLAQKQSLRIPSPIREALQVCVSPPTLSFLSDAQIQNLLVPIPLVHHPSHSGLPEDMSQIQVLFTVSNYYCTSPSLHHLLP